MVGNNFEKFVVKVVEECLTQPGMFNIITSAKNEKEESNEIPSLVKGEKMALLYKEVCIYNKMSEFIEMFFFF
jgi:hypothetical protein